MPEQFSLFDLEPAAEPVAQPCRPATVAAADVQQYEVAVDGSAVGSNPGFAGWGWYLSPTAGRPARRRAASTPTTGWS